MSIDNKINGIATAKANSPTPTINCVLFSSNPPVRMKYIPAIARIVGIISEYNNKNSII